MVNSLSILFMFVSVLIAFGLPIGLTIYFYKKERISIKAVLIGVCVFLISQVFTRIPLLNIIARQEWFSVIGSNALLYAIFLGFSAGVFEEVGRYLGFKLFLRDRLNWKTALAAGIGHGGIEAIVILGLSYISFIMYAFMINTGTFEVLIASQLPSSTAELIRNTLVGTPSWTFLLAGLERVMAIILHLGFSLIVMYGMISKRRIYLLYAILLHGAINAVVGFMSIKGISILVIEGVLALFIAVVLWYIRKSRSAFNVDQAM